MVGKSRLITGCATGLLLIGIAASAAYIAKVLFFIFILLFILSFVFGRRRGIDSRDIIP